MNKFVISILLILISQIAMSRTYKLEGTVGGKYPIVVELEEDDRGLFSGKYAYKSTLQKRGNLDCSWLHINPSYQNPATQWDISDCKFNPAETWYNVRFSDGKHLTAMVKNVQGNAYNVTANVIESSAVSPSWVSHFKAHIGDSPSDFDMFTDPSIQQRWGDMMGENNFNYLVSIYQTQGGIEYAKGMYWGSAFVAHQCCDPATVWAYDADNNAFYVWIRKDDRDYWWSETGSIPLKFRELVESRF